MRSSQARASLVTVIACGPGAPKSARIVPAGAGTTGVDRGLTDPLRADADGG